MSVNPKLRQDQIAKELGCPSSTLHRFRQDINIESHQLVTKEDKRSE